MAVVMPAALALLLLPTPQSRHVTSSSTPIHDAIARSVSAMTLSRTRPVAAAKPVKPSTAAKIEGGVIGAVAGFFGGTFVGYTIDRHCGCDDAGLKGAVIGASIGTVAGAILGTWIASR